MEHGDLSNEVGPVIIIIFDGAVGTIPKDLKADYDKAIGKRQWKKAADMWRLSSSMLDQLVWLTWHKNFNVELVTWQPEQVVPFLEARLEREAYPVRGFESSSPQALARELVRRPYVVAVYGTEPSSVTPLGGKGRLLTDPKLIGRM